MNDTELVKEIGGESAVESRLTKYVVVQMTTTTWEKLQQRYEHLQAGETTAKGMSVALDAVKPDAAHASEQGAEFWDEKYVNERLGRDASWPQIIEAANYSIRKALSRT